MPSSSRNTSCRRTRGSRPAVRYVIENNIMLPAGHIDGKEYFPWFNPAENRCTVAEAIYNSAKLVDPKLTASLCGHGC